jgi:hypothetical protein
VLLLLLLLLLLLYRSEELIEQGSKWLIDGGSLDFTGAILTDCWQQEQPGS